MQKTTSVWKEVKKNINSYVQELLDCISTK